MHIIEAISPESVTNFSSFITYLFNKAGCLCGSGEYKLKCKKENLASSKFLHIYDHLHCVVRKFVEGV